MTTTTRSASIPSDTVRSLRALPVGEEMVVDGAIWYRGTWREWKVSPKGLAGDYDTNCYWVDSVELDEMLEGAVQKAAFAGHATCPDCGHKGPHETNGMRRFAELSLLCAGCGYSFDPADQ